MTKRIDPTVLSQSYEDYLSDEPDAYGLPDGLSREQYEALQEGNLKGYPVAPMARFVNLTEAKCPRCESPRLSISLTSSTMMVLGSIEGEAVVSSHLMGTDGFEQLSCEQCRLTLANTPGETRLRKAKLYDSMEAATRQRHDPITLATHELDSAWFEAGMRVIAEAMCAFSIDTETVHELEEN